jgi:hypothetical protein
VRSAWIPRIEICEKGFTVQSPGRARCLEVRPAMLVHLDKPGQVAEQVELAFEGTKPFLSTGLRAAPVSSFSYWHLTSCSVV